MLWVERYIDGNVMRAIKIAGLMTAGAIVVACGREKAEIPVRVAKVCLHGDRDQAELIALTSKFAVEHKYILRDFGDQSRRDRQETQRDLGLPLVDGKEILLTLQPTSAEPGIVIWGADDYRYMPLVQVAGRDNDAADNPAVVDLLSRLRAHWIVFDARGRQWPSNIEPSCPPSTAVAPGPIGSPSSTKH
ncbi:hypothetical protein ACO2Q3_22685 [Caulobacter sp. KR2-114]|uniref:hypothetical protein n=1 Tax=Caulobacter sp. KR2-114 TaxID=3400912 RepID=UPI003C0ED196